VRECVDCQRKKVELTHPASLLQLLPIPERKWESVFMDIITGLPAAQGQDYIYLVANRLTKFAHFFVISSRSSASWVVEMFFQEVF